MSALGGWRTLAKVRYSRVIRQLPSVQLPPTITPNELVGHKREQTPDGHEEKADHDQETNQVQIRGAVLAIPVGPDKWALSQVLVRGIAFYLGASRLIRALRMSPFPARSGDDETADVSRPQLAALK